MDGRILEYRSQSIIYTVWRPVIIGYSDFVPLSKPHGILNKISSLLHFTGSSLLRN